MRTTLIVASLPVPLSVNEIYATTKHGKRVLTWEGKQWKENIYDYLNKGVAPKPYCIQRLNSDAIYDLRSAYTTNSKARRVLALQKQYAIDVLLVYDSERRDIDGGYKILQDTLCDWLAMKHTYTPNFFNDRRIVQGDMKRLVTQDVPPHCEVALYEREVSWTSGSLLHRYAIEAQLGGQYLEQATEKMDFSLQTTARIEAV